MEMLVKWKKIMDVLTEKEHKILKEVNYDRKYKKHWTSYLNREGSKTTLKKLKEKTPNKDFRFNSEFNEWLKQRHAGAYLAGVIDGDGCFQIRKRYSDPGYEKLLKISDKNSEKLLAIQQLLLKNNMPKGYITEYANHSDLWVYINKQFNKWLIANVLPHMTITYKIKKCLGSPGGEM